MSAAAETAAQPSAPRRGLLIALVGPCASGKSTLAAILKERGYRVRQPAQEHSGIPDLWRRHGAPDLLVVLEAELATLLARRPHALYDAGMLARQRARLAEARAAADLVIAVDALAPEEIAARIEAVARAA